MPPATEADAGNAEPDNSSDAKVGGKDAQHADSAKPRSKKPLIILGAVVVIAAVIAFFVWFAHRNQVSTDDAYTDGNVITMAPKVSGYVVELLIDDNSRVRKGELLLRIDPQDFRTARVAALSQLALAKAQLKTAETALRIARVQYLANWFPPKRSGSRRRQSSRRRRRPMHASIRSIGAPPRRKTSIPRRANN